jgi:hypothetical protein
MNKRIKELAEQAGYSKDYLEIGLPSNMEKFAELIVLECANWIKNTDSDPDIGEEDAKALLEHFGVEE